MPDLIQTDSSPESRLDPVTALRLKMIVGIMIPAEGDFPSASDDDIFSDLLTRIAGLENEVESAVNQLLAQAGSADELDGMTADQQQALVQNAADNGQFGFLTSTLLTAYYQNDRVMRALGVPARPAFPEGYEIAQTDWGLVEPVKARGTCYRPAPD